MKGILLFLGSTGAGKLLPLLFGTFVTKKYGHEGYVLLVQILSQSNFLTAVSTVSYVQLILSRHGGGIKSPKHKYPLRAVVFSSLVSLLGGAWAIYSSRSQGFGVEAVLIGLVVVTYSLGNSILTTVISQLNAEYENARAGLLMFVGLVFPYLIGFACVEMHQQYHFTFGVIGILFLVIAWVIYGRRNASLFHELKENSLFELLRQSIPVEKEHLPTMAFVGIILYSHSYLITKVNSVNGVSDSAIFALGYQLFSMGLFIPGILGNVVIPRLSHGGGKAAIKINNLLVLYASIGIIWIVAVYFFAPTVIRIYRLTVDSGNLQIILLLQVAVLFGSMNALVNQKLIADRHLISLASLAAMYFSVVFTWGHVFGFGVKSSACGLTVAYVSVLTGYGFLKIRERQVAPTADEIFCESRENI